MQIEVDRNFKDQAAAAAARANELRAAIRYWPSGLRDEFIARTMVVLGAPAEDPAELSVALNPRPEPEPEERSPA